MRLAMTISTLRRLALSITLSLAALGGGVLAGCASSGDPTPGEADGPAEIVASEGCEDEASLAEIGVSKDECLRAAVVVSDPNSGEANGCVPGTVLFKKVDPGPPRLVSICKCRQDSRVDCFIRN
jgi:hypothetical protein